MAAGNHFGWPKITFDRISRHFRSIRNFLYLFIWPKITFDRISLHFRSIRNFFFSFFSQNGSRRPFWIAENHFRSHFSRWIRNFYFFWNLFTKWPPASILDDRKSLSLHIRSIRMKIMFDRISRHFRSIHNSFSFFFKMAAGGHFGIPICAKNNRVLPLCVINVYTRWPPEDILFFRLMPKIIGFL